MTHQVDTIDVNRAGRARRRSLQVALVLAPLAIALGLFASPASAAGASITVSPNSGLSDGQTVTVKGTGFKANTAVLVLECPENATGSNGGSVCDVNDGKIGDNKSDASGNFTTSLKVRVHPSKSIDCTKVSCVIQAHEGFNPNSGQTATAPLHFAAAAPTTNPPTTTPTAITPPQGQGTSSSAAAGGNGGGAATNPAVPTGANTGHGVSTSPPLLAEIGVALAALLLAAGLLMRRQQNRLRGR